MDLDRKMAVGGVIVVIALICVLFSPTCARADSLRVVTSNVAWFRDTKTYNADEHLNRGGNGDLTLLDGISRRSYWDNDGWDTVLDIETDSVIFDSSRVQFYCSAVTPTATVNIYTLWQYWYEGDSSGAIDPGGADPWCYYHTDSPYDSQWTKRSADFASDGGALHSSDSAGADRAATAKWTWAVNGTGGWWACSFTGPETDSLAYGLKDNYGYIMITTSTSAVVFSASENATAGQRPIITYFYHIYTAAGTDYRRRRLLIEGS